MFPVAHDRILPRHSGGADHLPEWVAHVEEVKPPEVTVVGIECLDAMRPQERRQVRVRDEVTSRQNRFRRRPVGVSEPVALCQETGVRQAEQCLDVVHRLSRRSATPQRLAFLTLQLLQFRQHRCVNIDRRSHDDLRL